MGEKLIPDVAPVAIELWGGVTCWTEEAFDWKGTATIMRDPLYVSSAPLHTGYYTLINGHSLYYEVRGHGNNKADKICMVMGAFGSSNWFEQLADHLAIQGGFQVLTFDHRGVGRSRRGDSSQELNKAVDHLTAPMMADDCLSLVDHVWGPHTPFHLYGASMGGMIAQEVALNLVRSPSPIQRGRLKSLMLAVTCRGIHLIHGLEPLVKKVIPFLYDTGVIRYFIPLLISSNKEAMLKHLLSVCFSEDYLNSLHPTGECHRDIWHREWSKNYEQWSTFHDIDVCAQHVMVLATHYLTDQDAQSLRMSGIPITTHIATKDKVIPTFKQEALAASLDAAKIFTRGGHMGDTINVQDYLDEILAHFKNYDIRHKHSCSSGSN